jgi:hypothetical protein
MQAIFFSYLAIFKSDLGNVSKGYFALPKLNAQCLTGIKMRHNNYSFGDYKIEANNDAYIIKFD